MAIPALQQSPKPVSYNDGEANAYTLAGLNQFLDRCAQTQIASSFFLVPLSRSRFWALLTYPNIGKFCSREDNLSLASMVPIPLAHLSPGKSYGLFSNSIEKIATIVGGFILPPLAQMVSEYLNTPLFSFGFMFRNLYPISTPCPQDHLCFINSEKPFDATEYISIREISDLGRHRTVFKWDQKKKYLSIDTDGNYILQKHSSRQDLFVKELA